MRKTLLATTALAFAGAMAAGPALAADKMSIGVSGFMQQWFGMSSVDAKDKDGNSVDLRDGTAQQSDSEIHFKGKLEADNGLTFSVKVELEGNNKPRDGYSTAVVDESQLTIAGEFGQVVLGAEDPASTLTHHGNQDVGITLNCGDTHKWIDANGLAGCSHNGFGTSGHGHGDKNSISYYSPRISGVQFGATYIPDVNQETEALAANANNDTDAWSVGGNYKGEFGGANIAVSLGHYQASQVAAKQETEEVTLTDGTVLEAITQQAYAGSKIDDRTFTNFGLQVGFGAFGFDVAYAENDGGMYMANGKKNGARDWETVSAGVMYSDGPMAVSLSHMATEWDSGTDQNATMLSMSYSLAPGVASKTSIFAADRSNSDKSSVEGTAFVTGFVIGF